MQDVPGEACGPAAAGGVCLEAAQWTAVGRKNLRALGFAPMSPHLSRNSPFKGLLPFLKAWDLLKAVGGGGRTRAPSVFLMWCVV